MPIDKKSITEAFQLDVLIRLLKNNEPFNISCSKSGLSINSAQKLLHKISY